MPFMSNGHKSNCPISQGFPANICNIFLNNTFSIYYFHSANGFVSPVNKHRNTPNTLLHFGIYQQKRLKSNDIDEIYSYAFHVKWILV